MEHLKCNLFCIVKHLSGIAATSLTLILPLDSTRRATPCAQPLDPARLSCPDCGLQGTQETQWKYLKLAENARSTVPIKSMPFWVALRLSPSLSRSISLSSCTSDWAEPTFLPATCHIYTNSLVRVPSISAFASGLAPVSLAAVVALHTPTIATSRASLLVFN